MNVFSDCSNYGWGGVTAEGGPRWELASLNYAGTDPKHSDFVQELNVSANT